MTGRSTSEEVGVGGHVGPTSWRSDMTTSGRPSRRRWLEEGEGYNGTGVCEGMREEEGRDGGGGRRARSPAAHARWVGFGVGSEIYVVRSRPNDPMGAKEQLRWDTWTARPRLVRDQRVDVSRDQNAINKKRRGVFAKSNDVDTLKSR
uniref:Uncharacterized protein n=1 Tax=Oryza brachyantha TaxID=4533 RepID=J3LR10_ORYBR